MNTWLFKNGSKIEVVITERSIRGNGFNFTGHIHKPSMWCSVCQVWTKDYEMDGNHACGTEVTTGSLDSGYPDIDYEGEPIQ